MTDADTTAPQAAINPVVDFLAAHANTLASSVMSFCNDLHLLRVPGWAIAVDVAVVLLQTVAADAEVKRHTEVDPRARRRLEAVQAAVRAYQTAQNSGIILADNMQAVRRNGPRNGGG